MSLTSLPEAFFHPPCTNMLEREMAIDSHRLVARINSRVHIQTFKAGQQKRAHTHTHTHAHIHTQTHTYKYTHAHERELRGNITAAPHLHTGTTHHSAGFDGMAIAKGHD